MTTLLNIENYPNTESLMRAVNEQFARGVDMVNMSDGSRLVGSMLSPEAMKKAIARKVAEQWINNPSAIDELASSLEEEADEWDA